MKNTLMLRTMLFLLVLAAVAPASPRQQASYEASPIHYSRSKPSDPVRALEAKLAGGQSALAFDGSQGFLKALLEAMDIPISSQSLVFSKTSFQRQWINPRSPRALYFNDEVYVGWVRGGDVLEIASQDPQLGSVFYTVAQDPARPARFLRQTDNCLQCHDSSSLTLGVPGVTVRSVYPGGDGLPRFHLGGFRTTYRSPLEERWGGWYVTGEHGAQRHMGNVIFPDEPNPDMKQLGDRGANLTDLKKKADLEPYLTDTSDIVALMVLEYQTNVHNLITRSNHETRGALVQNDDIARALGYPNRPLTEGTERRLRYACDPLIEALLYSGEAVLTDRVKGNSTFVAEFEKRGPFDRQGRSLRQMDLTKRMFKYPLSYLVYSKAFAGLPPEARDYIAGRLGEILAGRDPRKEFSHLTAEDRRAVIEIVKETLPGLSAGWK
jgi:hypothetical protein